MAEEQCGDAGMTDAHKSDGNAPLSLFQPFEQFKWT